MRYAIEPRNRIYVKGYGFLSIAKSIDIRTSKVGKNMGNKYSQRLLNSAKKSTKDAIKTASKRATQKNAEAIPDLIGNKTANKLTNLSKKISQKDETNNEIEIPKEKFMSLVKRQQVIDELGIV